MIAQLLELEQLESMPLFAAWAKHYKTTLIENMDLPFSNVDSIYIS
jgi:hypothetical protein